MILQKLCLLPQMETQRLLVTPSWAQGCPYSENTKLNSSVAQALVSLLCSVWTSAFPQLGPEVIFIRSGLLMTLTLD